MEGGITCTESIAILELKFGVNAMIRSDSLRLSPHIDLHNNYATLGYPTQTVADL